MIVNDDSSVINKLATSLIDDPRVIIYDCHTFIVQATVEPHSLYDLNFHAVLMHSFQKVFFKGLYCVDQMSVGQMIFYQKTLSQL